MRLLDTKNLNFHEFLGAAIPQYCILSHTWGDEEVSYQDMLAASSSTKAKSGYRKIHKAAEVARSMAYNFVWVDTCCIDKSSSAELTEAINSMYQWYKESSLCLAYLVDVPPGSIRPSRWFTRGWTLQELIAPTNLLFLSSDWRKIEWKTNIKTQINELTGIPAEALGDGFRSAEWSAAEKLSWAAQRETTRTEDMAYCLLGLFDINMPLLYGEGDRAFFRMQEEIIKHNNDYTIFLWASTDTSLCSYRGLLAKSPKEFQTCHGITVDLQEQGNSAPFSVTNAGLHLDITLIPWVEVASSVSSSFTDQDTKFGRFIKPAVKKIFLPVFRGTDHSIFLLKLNQDGEQYARIWPNKTPKIERDLLKKLRLYKLPPTKCYVRQNILIARNHIPVSLPKLSLDSITSKTGLHASWLGKQDVLYRSSPLESLHLEAIGVEVSLLHYCRLWVVVGYDFNSGECWCDLDTDEAIPRLLDEYCQLRRPRKLYSAIWRDDKWSCTVTVGKELKEDILVLSIRAVVDFLDFT